MLSAIKASFMEVVNTSDIMNDAKMDKVALHWNKIQEYFTTHDYIMNADVRELCGVLAATANWILTKLTAEGRIVKNHKGGYWIYKPESVQKKETHK